MYYLRLEDETTENATTASSTYLACCRDTSLNLPCSKSQDLSAHNLFLPLFNNYEMFEIDRQIAKLVSSRLLSIQNPVHMRARLGFGCSFVWVLDAEYDMPHRHFFETEFRFSQRRRCCGSRR
jgi:hypothetical protein